MADQDPDQIADLLHDCEEVLIELKENHRLVQDGGKAFAELAQKLRVEMDRRSGTDRRAGNRPGGDRRGRAATSA